MYSCTHSAKKDEHILKFDPQKEYPSVSESDYTFTYKLIPLETHPDCLISSLMSIHTSKDYIYTQSIDDRNVNIFTKTGKFVKQLPVGRGVGEIMYPLWIIVDEEQQRLEVLDFYKQIKSYTLEGEYIEAIPCPSCFEFNKMGQTYLFWDGNSNKESDYNFYIRDKKGEKPWILKNCMKNARHVTPAHSCIHKDTLLFNTIFDNKIYFITSSDPTPRLFMQIENVYDGTPEFTSYKDLDKYCKSNNIGAHIYNPWLFDNSQTFIMNLYNKCYLFDLRNQATYVFDIFKSLPHLFRYIGHKQNTAYFYFFPSLLEKILALQPTTANKSFLEQIKQIAPQLDAEDNPIIVQVEINRKK